MSFYLTRTNTNTNVMTDYKKIAEAFCLEYYTAYDDNIEKLRKFYHADAKFLYFDHEFNGFNEWYNVIKHNNFYRFVHLNMDVNVIPICDSNLLITITGGIQINNSGEIKFVENILLQKDNNNNFCICTTMFKLLQ